MRKPFDANTSSLLNGGASFPVFHRVFRALWTAVWLVLGSWTPAPLHRWRVILLRCFGARVAWSARVYGSARIWFPPNLTMGANAVLGPGVNCYCMDEVHIGEKAVVSQGAELCAGSHDIADVNFQLITRPIVVGSRAWVAANAFIGPGAVIGEGAVVGACAVLFGEAESWSVYIGNPATLLRRRELR